MLRPTLLLLVLMMAAAQEPPEIVALTSAASDFRPLFESGALNSELRQKIASTTWHAGCPVSPDDLRELRVSYWDFGGRPATGSLVVHREAAAELASIFRELFRHGFLIERMEPVEHFGGSDDASMEANNTSAFNCRDVTGQPGEFSNHSWGRAIDINPLTNPYVKGDYISPPEGRKYLDRTHAVSGSILRGDFVVKRFAKAGWKWGGDWIDLKDYQHFEKPIR